jgi:streptogramin lyase
MMKAQHITIISLLLAVMALAGCGGTGGTQTGNGETLPPASTPTPRAASFAAFPVSAANTSGATAITIGPDGNLWFTEGNIATIARMTPDGQITEFRVPPNGFVMDGPGVITTGPDGNLWFTLPTGFGRITPDGQITKFALQNPRYRGGGSITAGPDGNVWFTGGGSMVAGRITPDGQITEFPGKEQDSSLKAITAGPDGNLWFLDTFNKLIERITPDGQLTEFPIPNNGYPLDITAGPDGNLWFTESIDLTLAIGRITPAGEITTFPLSTPFLGLGGLTIGPDKNLWFTSPGDDQHFSLIGHMTLDNQQFTSTQITLKGSRPDQIVTAPDGSFWFDDYGLEEIVHFTPGN